MWIHNFSANKVLHDLDSYHTSLAVFPNLRKEWVTFVHLIVITIGTVLETYDKPCQIKYGFWELYQQNF